MNTSIYTVSQLNLAAKQILESRFLYVTVEGEVSNFVKAASGHWYFSLKDDKAQIRAAMFRGANQSTRFAIAEGDLVQVRAKVSLYAPRGDYQLIVEHIEPQGDGLLRQAFEALKLRLEKKGYFSMEHKRPIPNLPKCIGVVTSSSGAAIHDIVKVLKRRNPAIDLILYPSLVQGETAAKSIAKQIEQANLRAECDVLIVGRGGGSLEDLWAFNEEVVADAIFNSALPIVSAVGHEVDVSIADFVADVRAATPSAAAELLAPAQEQQIRQLDMLYKRLRYLLDQELKSNKATLGHLSKRLRSPSQRIQEKYQQLDYDSQRLQAIMASTIMHRKQSLAALSAKLEALSPLSTMSRGYSILSKQESVIRSAEQVEVGEQLIARTASGSLLLTVEKKLFKNQ